MEIEPSVQKDRVAYVCVHTKQIRDVHLILSSFRQLLSARDVKTEDRDFEIVLAIKGNSMSLRSLVAHLERLVDSHLQLAESIAAESASLSFRINGISPNQTASSGSSPLSFSQIANIGVSAVIFTLTCGLHILNYSLSWSSKNANVRLQTFAMGLAGYVSITIFTFLVLNLIKAETVIEPVRLPKFLENATWTFSDSRHSGHRFFDLPTGRSLVHATPAVFSHAEKLRRSTITLILCLCLAASFIVFYLGTRVAQWWVALGSLALIWLAAGLRSLVIRNFLVAKHGTLGEHWLGVFHDNIYILLLATVDTMQDTVEPMHSLFPGSSLHGGTKVSANPEKADAIVHMPSHTLIVAKPIRQSIKSWSGCEDVMKVSLEMSKLYCRTNKFTPKGRKLELRQLPTCKRILRFQLMIWVPGLVWKANSLLDYILTQDFDFPNLYRDLLKIIHLCGDVHGKVTRHEVCAETQTQLSHVLCGKVNLPDPRLHGDMDLTTLLTALRNVNPSNEKAYTLEQIMLLPTIQMASIYESFPIDTTKSRIQTLQDAHTDKLILSGAEFLPVLQNLFDELQVWDSFMKAKPKTTYEKTELQPRDETSGLYGRHVGKTDGLDDEDQKCSVTNSAVDPKMRNRLEPMDAHLYFEQHRPWMQVV